MATAKKGPARRTTKKAQRAASEQAILRAFDLLFRRHGVAGVGVNSVLAEARVGKRLLYEYFGDLKGVATAWARDRGDPLALGASGAKLRKALASLPAERRTAGIAVQYARALREHPWAAQVLLSDLDPRTELAPSLRELRKSMGADYEAVFLEQPLAREPDQLGLLFVLHAAAQYLALRARFAPDYNGIDLSTPRGWQAAMEMMAGVGAASGRPRNSSPRSRKE